MQQLIEMAAQLFMSKVGKDLDVTSVVGALKGLLPTNGDDLDIAGLVSKFSGDGGGLMALAQSWLSDGPNSSLSMADVIGFFGEGAVGDFASKLDIGKDTAASGLADMIPELIDKSSEGGSLMDNIGAGLGKKLLGGLF